MKAIGYVFKPFDGPDGPVLHFIPVVRPNELRDFMEHGWLPVIPENIPSVLAQFEVVPDNKLSAAQGYPVATRPSARR